MIVKPITTIAMEINKEPNNKMRGTAIKQTLKINMAMLSVIDKQMLGTKTKLTCSIKMGQKQAITKKMLGQVIGNILNYRKTSN